RAAAQFTEEDLTRFFQILLQTDDDLRRKPDPRIHLEMGLLRLINASRLAPLEELLAEVKNGGSSGSAPPSGGSRPGSSTPLVRGASVGAAMNSAPPSAPVTVSSSGAVSFAPFAGAPPSAVEGGTVSAPKTSASALPRALASSAVGAPDAVVASGDSMPSEPAPTESTKPNGRTIRAEGVSFEQVAEIKSAIQSQQKFLAELV